MTRTQRRRRNRLRATVRPRKRRRRERALNEEQRVLAERFLPLARKLAQPMKWDFPWAVDDIESAACLALVKAARSFNRRRKVKFTTYAANRIRGALMDLRKALVIQRHRERGLLVNTEALWDLQASGQVPLFGCLPQAAADEAVIEAELLESWLRLLPVRHAEACRLLYLEGLDQGQAAARMHCSQARLSALHSEALELLGAVHEERYLDPGEEGEEAVEDPAVFERLPDDAEEDFDEELRERGTSPELFEDLWN